jgi:Domain of Unknown Function (DUF1206)
MIWRNLSNRRIRKMAQWAQWAVAQLRQWVLWLVAQTWFKRMARLGYASKGILYMVVGWLVAKAALGSSSRTTSPIGALRAIVSQPFGKVLLGSMMVGLVGYVLWRSIQAIFDPEAAHQSVHPKSVNAKRIALRMGYALSGLSYAGLAMTAVELITETEIDTDYANSDGTANFLAQPVGQWLLGLAGLWVIGVGVSYLYYAYQGKFYRNFKLHQMSPLERALVKGLGRFGIAARGAVFGIVGGFLIQTAVLSEARAVKGLSDALLRLEQQPFGHWILGAVAVGLLAYGLYALVEARYRQIAGS